MTDLLITNAVSRYNFVNELGQPPCKVKIHTRGFAVLNTGFLTLERLAFQKSELNALISWAPKTGNRAVQVEKPGLSITAEWIFSEVWLVLASDMKGILLELHTTSNAAASDVALIIANDAPRFDLLIGHNTQSLCEAKIYANDLCIE